METRQGFGSATVLFSHLIFLHNRAAFGGGLAMHLEDNNKLITVSISSCYFSQGLAVSHGGGLFSHIMSKAIITIQNTDFVDNIQDSVAKFEWNVFLKQIFFCPC